VIPECSRKFETTMKSYRKMDRSRGINTLALKFILSLRLIKTTAAIVKTAMDNKLNNTVEFITSAL
jgi:hypothetical protein